MKTIKSIITMLFLLIGTHLQLFKLKVQEFAGRHYAYSDVPVGAVANNAIFGETEHSKGIRNKNDLPADNEVIARLAMSGGQPLRWVGKISQASTAAPTAASIVTNQLITAKTPTTANTIVWARTGTGVYTGTLAGAFNGTLIGPLEGLLYGDDSVVDGRFTLVRTSDDVITLSTFALTTGSAADDLLTAHNFIIELIPDTGYLDLNL